MLDVGQVLVALDYPTALRRVKPYSRLAGEEITQRMANHPGVPLYESGRLPTQAFYEMTCKLLEMEVSLADFKSGWASIFAFDTPEGQCISPQLFRELKCRYQMVAVSNTNEMHWKYLETTFPLIHEFDEQVLSFRVGAMKPDPVIYREALARARCSPSEAIFIDDLPVNIEAAEQLGIKGILYQGEAKLRAELTRLGLLD